MRRGTNRFIRDGGSKLQGGRKDDTLWAATAHGSRWRKAAGMLVTRVYGLLQLKRAQIIERRGDARWRKYRLRCSRDYL